MVTMKKSQKEISGFLREVNEIVMQKHKHNTMK